MAKTVEMEQTRLAALPPNCDSIRAVFQTALSPAVQLLPAPKSAQKILTRFLSE